MLCDCPSSGLGVSVRMCVFRVTEPLVHSRASLCKEPTHSLFQPSEPAEAGTEERGNVSARQ